MCEHKFEHNEKHDIITCTECKKRWEPAPIFHFEIWNYREGTKTGYVNGEWVTVPGGLEIDYGDTTTFLGGYDIPYIDMID